MLDERTEPPDSELPAPVARFLEGSCAIECCIAQIIMLHASAQGDDLGGFKEAIAKLWRSIKTATPVIGEFENEVRAIGDPREIVRLPGTTACSSFHEAALRLAERRWCLIWEDEVAAPEAVFMDLNLDAEHIDFADENYIDDIWGKVQQRTEPPESSWRQWCEFNQWKKTKEVIEDFPSLTLDDLTVSLWRERAAVLDRIEQWAKESRPANCLPQCVYLGDGKLQIGDAPPITLQQSPGEIIEAMVTLRTASTNQLTEKSGHDRPGEKLKRAIKSHPKLGEYIKLPGGKSRGGYSTTIIDGRGNRVQST